MAAPKILNLGEVSPDDFPLYFFDANVWIAWLKRTGGKSINSFENDYVDFFEMVIKIHLRREDKFLAKKTKYFPKIVLPALALTEIINAAIRIESEAYSTIAPLLSDGRKPTFKDYRQTDMYKKQLRQIVSDFQAVQEFIEMRDDHFTQMKILDNFGSNPDFDFNDYFYSLIFKNTDIPIVTNDRDYAMFDGITIITSNPKILKIR